MIESVYETNEWKGTVQKYWAREVIRGVLEKIVSGPYELLVPREELKKADIEISPNLKLKIPTYSQKDKTLYMPAGFFLDALAAVEDEAVRSAVLSNLEYHLKQIFVEHVIN